MWLSVCVAVCMCLCVHIIAHECGFKVTAYNCLWRHFDFDCGLVQVKTNTQSRVAIVLFTRSVAVMSWTVRGHIRVCIHVCEYMCVRVYTVLRLCLFVSYAADLLKTFVCCVCMSANYREVHSCNHRQTHKQSTLYPAHAPGAYMHS